MTKRKQGRVVHIHTHSIYSPGDAMAKPREMAKRAKELGIDTIVLTDHGNISGVIQMKKACDEYGLKFIPGCEMYESPDRFVKESREDNYHVTMLPVNNEGWENLKFLIADANKNGFYYEPRTDMKFIEENNLGKHIIATSGCLGSYTSQLLLNGKYDEAKQEMIRRSKIFYEYYLEIQDNGSREQEIVNQYLIQISKETGIPLVYAKDVHYVLPEHKDPHHTLVAATRKQSVYECSPYPGTNTYHLAGADEVYEWAKENNIPYEAIENTWKIADKCNVDIQLGQDLLPEYEYCESGHTPATYLKKLLYDNLITYVDHLKSRNKKVSLKTYIDRIETEYRVIFDKKFPSYFLILWDIITWATNRKVWASYEPNRKWLDEEVEDWQEVKQKDGSIIKQKVIIRPNAKYEFYPEYLVGPGRGSAAGSLMAFLLGITKIDPLEYGLMFERFLNPYRNSMPDIDVDFPGDNHDLLLDFVAQRYGRDRTAQIKTFTFYKIKSTIDAVCKALEKKDKNGKVIAYGYKVADEVKAILEPTGDQAKMPDQSDCTYEKMMDICMNPQKYEKYGPSLPKFVEASRQFREAMEKYPELNDRLRELEGTIKTSGIHAGGVIISKRPLTQDCPVFEPTEDSKAVLPVTMWDYPDCETVGLLKMDLLRTSTLRIISHTLRLIEENTSKKIDIYEIGRDDEETFQYISEGQTHGLFQINGHGITRYTTQVKPSKQGELIDILALFRPGPLDATLENGNTIAEQYVINGKRKEKEYLKEVNPNMRDILRETRGQMVYQEQIMQLVQKIAGYNLGHADTFRRVIGKKKIDEMPKLHDEFVYGHKYVLKKWQKLLDEWDKRKTTNDKGEEVIVVKSAYDGNKVEYSKTNIENELSKTKKSMATFEIKGAVNNGYEEKFAHQLFKQMAAFAGYAFNKSHSTCYADETYQTAWLKRHYPVEFMTALLTVRGENKDKTLENLKEAKRMGIKIYPPHINRSEKGFYPEKDGIRFGLLSIAGIGEKAVDSIIEERKKNGDFTSLDDFVSRTKNPVNRGIYQKLIQAGCFDEFEPNRYKLLNHYNFHIRGDKVWEGTLAELLEDKDAKKTYSYPYNEDVFTELRALELERELIGIYLSGSPYEDLPYTSLSDMDYSRNRYDRTEYDVGGRIIKVNHFKSGKGARVTLETQMEPLDAVFFGKEYQEAKQHLFVDNIITIRGYKNKNYYQGKEEDQFVGIKILIREGNKIKKRMGKENQRMKEEKEGKNNKSEDLLILTQAQPKEDLASELFESDEKPKKKQARKKRRKKLNDEELFEL